jgi:hypothetical protein
MKLDLKVTTAEGLYTVSTNLFVIVAWERKYKRKASELATGIGIEDLAFMAYESCKQSNVPVPLLFDDYIKQLQAIEVVGQDAENPTDEAVTPTP